MTEGIFAVLDSFFYIYSALRAKNMSDGNGRLYYVGVHVDKYTKIVCGVC